MATFFGTDANETITPANVTPSVTAHPLGSRPGPEDDTIFGGGGRDYAAGVGGNDVFFGGAGWDIFFGGAGNDAGHGGIGFDRLDGGSGHDTLAGDDGNDTVAGGTGNDVLDGGPGFDTLAGNDGNDTLQGGTGNDVLDGGLGADVMSGGSGEDVYYVDHVGDLVDDVSESPINFDYVFASVSYTIPAPIPQLFLTGNSDLSGIGNEIDNVLYGNLGANFLGGLAGDDYLAGDAGGDTLDGGDGDDWLEGSGGADSMYGGAGNDLVAGSGYDETEGSDGDDGSADYLSGGDGDDFLVGEGADRFDGGAGDDDFDARLDDAVATVLDGGDGTDTVNLFRSGSGYWDKGMRIDLAAGLVSYPGQSRPSDALVDIENVSAGTGSDLLIGNSRANVFRAIRGDDTMIGGGGDDRLHGSTGDEILNGGAGADSLYGYLGDDIFVFAAGDSTPGVRDLIGGDPTPGADPSVVFERPGEAIGDLIDVLAIDADATRAGDQAFVFGTATGKGRLWAINSGDLTVIRGSVDGDPAPEFALAIDDGAVLASAYTADDFAL
jgi:Ca2+-binding RTX toxin-like protein